MNPYHLTREMVDALIPRHYHQRGVTFKCCTDKDRSTQVHTDGCPACPRCAYLGLLEGIPLPDGMAPSLYFKRNG